jgi:glycine dehydrogenase subunit 1
MRYLPLTDADRREMLSVIGVESVDALFADSARIGAPGGAGGPAPARRRAPGRAAASGHGRAERHGGLGSLLLRGRRLSPHVPATVDHLIQRSEYLTSYTPYQPEISQGTLQALYEFQTQVASLTGMEVANASMYDGSTATAEAVMMATRVTRRKKAVLSGGLHPHYVRTTETLAHVAGVSTQRLAAAVDGEAAVIAAIDAETACVVVQTPNVFGTATDVRAVAEAAHKAGALLIVVVTEVVSLGLLRSPGAMGADIVAAEGQSIGNALNFGGPYVGLFACTDKLVRQAPGRSPGETVDADGRRGFVLTLSRASSTSVATRPRPTSAPTPGLCALAFTIHMSLLGETGPAPAGADQPRPGPKTRDALAAVPGVEVLTPRFFNEFAVRLPRPARGGRGLAQRGRPGGRALFAAGAGRHGRRPAGRGDRADHPFDIEIFRSELREVLS